MILDNTKLYYLASPYSAPSKLTKAAQKRLMERRLNEITSIATQLMLVHDLDLILPIVTSCALRKFEPRLGTSWEYWQKTDSNQVKHCDVLLVAMMEGWDISVGVTAEINLAKSLKIPVYYLNPITFEVTE